MCIPPSSPTGSNVPHNEFSKSPLVTLPLWSDSMESPVWSCREFAAAWRRRSAGPWERLPGRAGSRVWMCWSLSGLFSCHESPLTGETCEQPLNLLFHQHSEDWIPCLNSRYANLLLPCHIHPSLWSVPPTCPQLCQEEFSSLWLLLGLTSLLESCQQN